MKRTRISFLLLVLMITFASCAKQPGSTRYKGKAKSGKPIPCPVKDC